MNKKQEIIQELIRISNEMAPSRITQQFFKSKSKVPLGTLRYQYGNFNKALSAAGLQKNQSGIHVSGYKKIDDNDLLLEIGRLWIKNGKRPDESILNADGKYSFTPYKKRWKSFNLAVDAYIKQYGIPEENEKSNSETETKKLLQTLNTNNIVLPSTHKSVLSGKSKRPLFFGEPIDFRGLRYAPINEQGVVYLFGMVSKEIGFLIESIRNDFPDCEGKRCIDVNRQQWQHIRIEFEYCSKNFLQHGHNPEGCDIIICWIHDWTECPIEVLELKSTIKHLSSK